MQRSLEVNFWNSFRRKTGAQGAAAGDTGAGQTQEERELSNQEYKKLYK